MAIEDRYVLGPMHMHAHTLSNYNRNVVCLQALIMHMSMITMHMISA
jgi:hypothetical protein